jgi:hypothetical protein
MDNVKEHVLSEYYAHENETTSNNNIQIEAKNNVILNNAILNTTYTNIQKNDKSIVQKRKQENVEEIEKKKLKN